MFETNRGCDSRNGPLDGELRATYTVVKGQYTPPKRDKTHPTNCDNNPASSRCILYLRRKIAIGGSTNACKILQLASNELSTPQTGDPSPSQPPIVSTCLKLHSSESYPTHDATAETPEHAPGCPASTQPAFLHNKSRVIYCGIPRRDIRASSHPARSILKNKD